MANLAGVPMDHFQTVLSCSAATHNEYSRSSLILCELGTTPSSIGPDSPSKDNGTVPLCLKPSTLSFMVAADSKANEAIVDQCKSASLLIDSEVAQGCPTPPLTSAAHGPCDVAGLYLKLRDLRVQNEVALEQGLSMSLAQVGLASEALMNNVNH